MKTFSIIFLFMIIIFTSCENGNVITGQINYEIEVIDGCEYLSRFEGYQSGFKFTHKGNCNNNIHNNIVYDTVYVIDGKILQKRNYEQN